MWLKVNENTKSFSRPWMGDERIEPASNGAFQVTEEVGEWLLADDGIEVERHDADSDT